MRSRNRGFLDIHGRPRKTVWTHLASSSLAGSNTVITDDAVDFVPGDKLVVTSSSRDFRQTEEVTVVSLDADNRTITVTPAFQFNHISTFYDVVGERVDLRCEVGLLSRNVIIQGDDDSDRQLFGAHTIAAGGGTFRYGFLSLLCLSVSTHLSHSFAEWRTPNSANVGKPSTWVATACTSIWLAIAPRTISGIDRSLSEFVGNSSFAFLLQTQLHSSQLPTCHYHPRHSLDTRVQQSRLPHPWTRLLC